MNTKDRILDSALKLFNDQGTGPVSTNHIAQAAGISPGNLYYHFRSKEAIIRALFERLYVRSDTALVLPTDRTPTVDDARALVYTNFQIMDEYRFVYREVVGLLRADGELKARWLEVRRRGYDGFHEVMQALAAAGVLSGPLDDAVITRLADLCWLISEFWLSEVEVSGLDIDDAHMQRGIDLMMQVLRPYIAL